MINRMTDELFSSFFYLLFLIMIKKNGKKKTYLVPFKHEMDKQKNVKKICFFLCVFFFMILKALKITEFEFCKNKDQL